MHCLANRYHLCCVGKSEGEVLLLLLRLPRVGISIRHFVLVCGPLLITFRENISVFFFIAVY